MASSTIIPVIQIDGLKFLLHKHSNNTDPLMSCTLETNDVCDGSIPGGYLRGTYKGGDPKEFDNSSVWINWGGMVEE